MRPTRSLRFAAAAAVIVSPFLLAVPSSAAPSFFWANPRPTGSEIGGIAFESASIGYAVGGFGTALRTSDGGVTWEDLTDLSLVGPDFDDVLVLSPGVLLAAGATPGIHRSTNAGASWTPVANAASGHLHNLFALDTSTLFAVGDAGRVIRSDDAGATWTPLASPAVTNLFDQWWTSAQTGYVIGQNCIRRTTNGGASWSTIPSVPESNTFFPGDVQFLDALNGWILNDFDTFRTTNGGTTWFELPTPFGQSPIYQEEALIIDGQTRFVATEAEGASIWKTTNDGTTWTELFNHQTTRGVTDLHRLPNGTILASTTAGDLYRSTDNGVTWINFTDVAGPDERMNMIALDLHESGLGFSGGYGPGLLQTADGGHTWFDALGDPGLVSTFALAVRDPSFALAGGVGTIGHSDVRRTTDGGASWTTHDLAASYVGYPQGLAAFDDGTCYCATHGGTGINFMYRSTDHGATWHLRNTGLSASVRFFDLFFLDSQRGFVFGGAFSNPAIFRTTDGGGQWSAVGETGLLGDEVRDMHWMDENTGFAVNSSRVQRTTNGGSLWTTVANGAGDEAIDFRDALHGVVDDFPNGARITTNGGSTWTPIALPMPGFISDVAAIADGFLVIGSTTSILGWDADAAPVGVESDLVSRGDGAPLRVWPNPLRIGTTPTLRFGVPGAPAGAASSVPGTPGSGGVFVPIEARLYDVTGRLLGRTPRAATESIHSLSLESVDLRPGVVFLELRDVNGRRSAHKIAVIR